VLERVVAFRIVHVDRLPRRQDEDLGKVLVFREPLVCPFAALVRNTDLNEAAGAADATRMRTEK